MSLRSRMLLTLSLLALFASAAVAEPVKLKVDATHSRVGFEVRHFFSNTPGRFKQIEADITFDPKNLAASAVTASATVASVDTENEKRDSHLQTADFFDAEKFPTLTFKSTKITPGKDGAFKLAGDLTMRGVTKPVVFDAKLLGSGPVDMGGGPALRAGFTATAVVNRKDFGINWNRTLDQGGVVLGDEVTIKLDIEAAEAK